MPLVFNQEWPKNSRQMLREFYLKSRELCGDVFCPIIHPANIREAAGAGPSTTWFLFGKTFKAWSGWSWGRKRGLARSWE